MIDHTKRITGPNGCTSLSEQGESAKDATYGDRAPEGQDAWDNARILPYSERIKEDYIFSFASPVGFLEVTEDCKIVNAEDSQRESYLQANSCTFIELNRGDGAVFKIVERDDLKGFGVFMENVHVIPSHYVYLKNPPKWIAWLIMKVYNPLRGYRARDAAHVDIATYGGRRND